MPILSRPMRRPVPVACTATLFALVLLVTGTRGYTLSRHDAFVAGTRWTDGPIWWQVGVGAALLVVAAWLWRRAVATLRA